MEDLHDTRACSDRAGDSATEECRDQAAREFFEPRLPRDEAVREIKRTSRKAWKVAVGYNRRSLVETTMYRMKTIFGGKLKNRKMCNQRTEVAAKMPNSQPLHAAWDAVGGVELGDKAIAKSSFRAKK